MAGNREFEMAATQGRLAGLANLFRAEMRSWFGTRTWLVQSLIWTLVVNGLLLTIITAGEGEAAGEIAALYGVFGGFFTAVAVVIIMQGAVVGEKISGTAAWVLSKPVTQDSFILAKWFGNAIGIGATAILVPGIGAYLVFTRAAGLQIEVLDFLAGMGVILVFDLFWLSLTLMLGAFFSRRGGVIGIALTLLLGQQFIVAMLAQLSERVIEVLPFALVMPDMIAPGESILSLVVNGEPLPTTLPIIATLVLIVGMTGLGIWRFNREEL